MDVLAKRDRKAGTATGLSNTRAGHTYIKTPLASPRASRPWRPRPLERSLGKAKRVFDKRPRGLGFWPSW